MQTFNPDQINVQERIESYATMITDLTAQGMLESAATWTRRLAAFKAQHEVVDAPVAIEKPIKRRVDLDAVRAIYGKLDRWSESRFVEPGRVPFNKADILRVYRALRKARPQHDPVHAMATATNYRNYAEVVAMAYAPLSPLACYDYVREAQHIIRLLGE